MKLEVLIVNKNHGHYLEKCLESLSRQSFDNFRVLLQDGNSSDSTSRIVKQFDFVEILSEDDLGSNDAFAKVVLRAKSEYITFLTSTDYLLDSRWLERAVCQLEANQSISMVVGGIRGVTNEGDKTSYKWPGTRSMRGNHTKLFYDFLFRGNGLTPISFVVRRDTFLRCIGNLSAFMNLDEECDHDLFWKFSYEFHSKPYAASFLDNDQVACRLHPDRRDDKGYLPKQQKSLHNLIRKRRREFLKSGASINFVGPEANKSLDLRLSYVDFVTSWSISLVEKSVQQSLSRIGFTNARNRVVRDIYGAQ